MKKAVSIILSIYLLLATTIPLSADSGRHIKITVNYALSDKTNATAESWNLWFEPTAQGRVQHKLAKNSDFGKTGTVRLKIGDNDKINIYALSENGDGTVCVWQLPIGENENTVEVWLMQGDGEIYYSEKDTVKNGYKKLHFTALNKISYELKNLVYARTATVTSEGSHITLPIETNDGKNGTLTLPNNISMGREYSLTIDGVGKKSISKQPLFDTDQFMEKYENDEELGAIYSTDKTDFAVWAPTASSVELVFYADGDKGEAVSTTQMQRQDNGIWKTSVEGDLDGQFYGYAVNVNGVREETVDLYARAGGINGQRSMVVDLKRTDPVGWATDDFTFRGKAADAVVYELHLRDMTIDSSSGVSNKGKFAGMAEKDTVNAAGQYTGLSHIKELGATHVQLMPIFDFGTVDENSNDGYNWGYDPMNYNLPEGSYSTDPKSGALRITELKEMVQALHDENIGVVMDVVYNHTYQSNSAFEKTVPDYYYRKNEYGNFSNGSGCGNETASERYMMKRYIIDSVLYWAKEYHIDGFRFDLMGLHDTGMMNEIRAELNKIDPSILVYGEGWQGGESLLDSSKAAVKANAADLTDGIAMFNDNFRDSVRGHVFDHTATGFLSGNTFLQNQLKNAIAASTNFSGANNDWWAKSPNQAITYVSAHDNLTLWDKLKVSMPDADDSEIVRVNKMCAALTFTSQGMPFILSGEEMGRSKGGDENSYNAGDEVNKIDWSLKSTNLDLFNYYKGLINLRKLHPAFTMDTTDQLNKAISFLDTSNDSNVVAYSIDGTIGGDEWKKIMVVINASKTTQTLTLPEQDWVVVVDGERSGIAPLENISGDMLEIPAQSVYVLADKESYVYHEEKDVMKNTPQPTDQTQGDTQQTQDNNDTQQQTATIYRTAQQNTELGLTVAAICLVALGAGVGYIRYLKHKNRFID